MTENLLAAVIAIALIACPSTRSPAKHWPLERVACRFVSVKPDSERRWTTYATSVIAFSLASFVTLFVLILAQMSLPLRAGASGMHLDTAFNSAISFVTNTNWQGYVGEVGIDPTDSDARPHRGERPRTGATDIAGMRHAQLLRASWGPS